MLLLVFKDYGDDFGTEALTIARMAASPVEGIMKVNAQTVKNLVEKVKEDKARKDREEKRKSKITKKIVSKRL